VETQKKTTHPHLVIVSINRRDNWAPLLQIGSSRLRASPRLYRTTHAITVKHLSCQSSRRRTVSTNVLSHEERSGGMRAKFACNGDEGEQYWRKPPFEGRSRWPAEKKPGPGVNFPKLGNLRFAASGYGKFLYQNGTSRELAAKKKQKDHYGRK